MDWNPILEPLEARGPTGQLIRFSFENRKTLLA
jgi:hypothetical protein